eukprot:gene5194-3710_t
MPSAPESRRGDHRGSASGGLVSCCDVERASWYRAIAPYLPVMALTAAVGMCEVVSALLMFVYSGIYAAIADKSSERFVRVICLSLLLAALQALAEATKIYCRDFLALTWRRELTRELEGAVKKTLHLAGRQPTRLLPPAASLRAQDLSAGLAAHLGDVPNLDQRIAQDVAELCDAAAKIVAAVVVLPAVVLFYTCYLSASIGPLSPFLCFLYFLLSIAVSYPIAQRVSPVVYSQGRLEGDFRLQWTRVLAQWPAIVLWQGGASEVHASAALFQQLWSNQRVLLGRQWQLNTATQGFQYAGSIATYAIGATAAALYDPLTTREPTDGAADATDATVAERSPLERRRQRDPWGLWTLLREVQRSRAIRARLAAASSPPAADDGHRRSGGGGGGGAVGPDRGSSPQPQPQPQSLVESPDAVERGYAALFREHAAATDADADAADEAPPPSPRRLLLRDVSFSVTSGTRLLVSGPTGCGKSTLLFALTQQLRASRGAASAASLFPHLLWPPGGAPRRLRVLHCPQTPYVLAEASLVANVFYPQRLRAAASPRQRRRRRLAEELLRLVGLVAHPSAPAAAATTLRTADAAARGLSQGEQQCLSVARLLFHVARRARRDAADATVVFLDEATSAMDEDCEALVYGLLRRFVAAFVSVGHRSTVRPFHRAELRLAKGDPAAWALAALAPA